MAGPGTAVDAVDDSQKVVKESFLSVVIVLKEFFD